MRDNNKRFGGTGIFTLSLDENDFGQRFRLDIAVADGQTIKMVADWVEVNGEDYSSKKGYEHEPMEVLRANLEDSICEAEGLEAEV